MQQRNPESDLNWIFDNNLSSRVNSYKFIIRFIMVVSLSFSIIELLFTQLNTRKGSEGPNDKWISRRHTELISEYCSKFLGHDKGKKLLITR